MYRGMIIDKRFETTLNDEDRRAVAKELQQTLVQLIDLALQSKQMHWTVVGAGFRPLHLHLDELVSDLRAWSDDVAERITAIGVAPVGTASRIVDESGVPNAPVFFVHDEDCAHLMVERLLFVANGLRERLGRIEPMDVSSHDLLTGILTGMEKHAWMLRASTLRRHAAGKKPTIGSGASIPGPSGNGALTGREPTAPIPQPHLGGDIN